MKRTEYLMRLICLPVAAIGLAAAAFAEDGATETPTALKFPQIVYRGTLVDGTPGATNAVAPGKKTMVFKAYDSDEQGAKALWTSDKMVVDIGTNGAFEVSLGTDELLCMHVISGRVSHVGLSLVNGNGQLLPEITPRRELRAVAAVNRALIADGAASDISIGTLTAKTLVANVLAVESLEASVAVTGGRSQGIGVDWFTVGKDEVTKIGGREVTVFAAPRTVATVGNPVRNQILWTATGGGFVLVHSSSASRDTLRIPGVVQHVNIGDDVRAPCTEHGGVSVVYYPFAAGRKPEDGK
ncbi:MAG: hypothetical protein KBT68_03300 [bacterium]|nr:hypothetical protein [Candidatus Colisoma equi]